MSARPQCRPGLLALGPYVQGKPAPQGLPGVVRLSSNESSYGPSPRAVRAYQDAAPELHRYPDGGQQELRLAIAAAHGLPADQILCGNGSEEILGLLIRAYAGEGDEIVLSENNFMMCPIYAQVQGARIRLAPERDHRTEVDAVLACVTPRTRMVILANPNNPTGTYLAGAEVRRLHAALPPEVLLVLDGAYAEYVQAQDFEDGAALVAACENVVMTRSFSKIHGLAGLRIGWAFMPAHVVDVLQRIRTPFNANRAAMAAAAAAVADVDHVAGVRARIGQAQQGIQRKLEALGLRPVPSVTNFYLVDFQGVPGATGRDAAAFLESRGVIPRPTKSAGSQTTLRITVGTDAENERALAALREYVTACRGQACGSA